MAEVYVPEGMEIGQVAAALLRLADDPRTVQVDHTDGTHFIVSDETASAFLDELEASKDSDTPKRRGRPKSTSQE